MINTLITAICKKIAQIFCSKMYSASYVFRANDAFEMYPRLKLPRAGFTTWSFGIVPEAPAPEAYYLTQTRTVLNVFLT